MAVSANKLELLQIADAVAREKSIDRSIVIAAMEDAIAQGGALALRRAKPKSAPRSIQRAANCALSRHMLVVEAGREPVEPDQPGGRAPAQSGRAGRRHHRRHPAAAGIWPHRRAIGQAGDRAEGARGRA